MKPILFALSAVLVLTACESQSTRPGQTSTITVGVIQSAQPVELTSNAGTGAALGGLAGWASAATGSSSQQARNAIIGAGLGGVLADLSQGNRSGMRYGVRTNNGNVINVVSDQTQMQVGDCVTVEEQSDRANIRRVSPTMCDRASSSAVASPHVQGEMSDDAAKCAQAKERLLAAKTEEETQTALRVAQILCND
ncbi:MAG: hypothetical protein AAGA91_13775 [Pseudomonadota bacterium]